MIMAGCRGILLFAIASILITACATDSALHRDQPNPAQLSADPDQAPRGAILQWGGEIIEVENFKDKTRLEILAYPLKDNGEPRTGKKPLGRFLADNNGYLEPREYLPGRRLTVSGILLGFKDGKVGDALYRYPALQVDSLTLWPEESAPLLERQPRVNVGIGVGSHGRSGVGIGIGF